MRMDLKLLRVSYKLTQTQMSEKLGCSVSTYNLIENGKRQGTIDFWRTVQNIFELDGETVWKMQNNQSKD